MTDDAWRTTAIPSINGAFVALAVVARTFGVETTPAQITHIMALGRAIPGGADVVRAAKRVGLKAKLVKNPTLKRLAATPLPALVKLKDGSWCILQSEATPDTYRLQDPVNRQVERLPIAEVHRRLAGDLVLVAKGTAAEADELAFALSWFFPAVKRYRKPLIEVLVLSFFISLLGLATPLSFQLVVDKVLTHKSYSTLVVVVGGMLLLAVFSALLSHLRQYLLQHTANRIDVELGARLFAHLVHLPISYFERRAAGVIVTRARELQNIRRFLTGQALLTMVDLAFFFVYFAVLFIYSKSLALLILLTLPLYVIIGGLLRPVLKRALKQKFRRWASGQQLMVESIIGIQTLKASAVEPIFMRRWEERLAGYVKVSFEATMLGVLASTSVDFINKATTAMVLFFGTLEVVNGSLSVGGLIAFNMIARTMTQPIMRLSQLWQDFQEAQVSVGHLADIFDTPVEGKAPGDARAGNETPQRLVGRIELADLSFRYRPELPLALKKISVRIEAGEVIGIVGPSGSGKSTLTKLLQRFYEPTSGNIFVDGMEIDQIDPTWLRRQLGVVLQENFLFNQTVHENIAMARPNMPRAGVVRVARLAGADEFISHLPQEYDTIIEERGANLSGGQRQRLAIARALATDPRILILDEATSALDYESERIVQANMSAIVQGRTVIIIAHRLAAVRHCDRIIGMFNGEIVEIGSHDELIRRPNGLYAHLWALQNENNTL